MITLEGIAKTFEAYISRKTGLSTSIRFAAGMMTIEVPGDNKLDMSALFPSKETDGGDYDELFNCTWYSVTL